MKEKIHPEYYPDAQIVCACGNIITAGSTRKLMKVESCSKCHPFFTGERKIMDTAGRVERFNRRYKRLTDKAAETTQPKTDTVSTTKGAPKKKVA